MSRNYDHITMRKPATITEAEKRAIEAYTGPVTICPPGTYTIGPDGLPVASGGRWASGAAKRAVAKHNAAQSAKKNSTREEVRALYAKKPTMEYRRKLAVLFDLSERTVSEYVSGMDTMTCPTHATHEAE